MSKTLASEAGTVQFPFLKHAADVGWTIVSEAEALRLRGGEQGLFFYKELEDALLRLNPGIVTPDNVQTVIQRMESVPNTQPRDPRMAARK
jgi:type I restriction enzyme, R subunit